MLFGHGISFETLSLSVNLIGGNMDESFDGLASLGTLQKDVSSVNVGMGKGKRVSKRVVDMGLGCKVKDSVDLLFSQDKGNQVGCDNVTFDEFEVGQVLELR
jgi:hypothetical protein